MFRSKNEKIYFFLSNNKTLKIEEIWKKNVTTPIDSLELKVKLQYIFRMRQLAVKSRPIEFEIEEGCPDRQVLLKKLNHGNHYMSRLPDDEAFLDFMVSLHMEVAKDPILDNEGELAGQDGEINIGDEDW